MEKIKLPKPRLPLDEWNVPHDAKPQVTVMGVVYDDAGNFPILYRSNRVRSAKNCWSLPSGWHEVGMSLTEQLAVEAHEELDVMAIPKTGEIIGVYENIATRDNWHWVMVIMTMRVRTLKGLRNVEPEKHSEIAIYKYTDILCEKFIKRPWAPYLGDALEKYQVPIYESIRKGLRCLPKSDYDIEPVKVIR